MTAKIKRTYKVQYQLGGASRTNHTSLNAAITALDSAHRAARRGGDCQGIYLQAYEQGPDDSYARAVPMTDDEIAKIERR